MSHLPNSRIVSGAPRGRAAGAARGGSSGGGGGTPATRCVPYVGCGGKLAGPSGPSLCTPAAPARSPRRSLQLKWVAAPLSYICTVALGVCLYHTAAEVRRSRRGAWAGRAREAGWACAGSCRESGAARRPPSPSPRPAVPPSHPPQAGVVPEVLPELSKGASAPFGLTSFALSTLLVLR